jgi:excisionase family DNA binding protein
MTASDTSRDRRRDTATVTEAARLLGVTVRTVQRRLDRGELSAIEAEGKRLVVMPQDATGDTTAEATGRDSDTRQDATHDTTQATHDATGDATPGDTSRDMTTYLLAEKDAHIADLRAQVDAQRLQIEAANRAAAEATAALREALRFSTRALPAPDTSTHVDARNARETRKSDATTKTTPDAKNALQSGTAREIRPLWRVILGLR